MRGSTVGGEIWAVALCTESILLAEEKCEVIMSLLSHFIRNAIFGRTGPAI